MTRRLTDEPVRRGRVCARCGIRIPLSCSYEYCRDCLKLKLFPEVRDYIRHNDVNELEVADNFGIDRTIIHDWIEEGRLEYNE